MTINWLAFLTVFVVTIVAACGVVALFSLAIRLLATPPVGAAQVGSERDEEMDHIPEGRPLVATIGASALFVLSGAVVLFGIWLMVPFFHQ